MFYCTQEVLLLFFFSLGTNWWVSNAIVHYDLISIERYA